MGTQVKYTGVNWIKTEVTGLMGGGGGLSAFSHGHWKAVSSVFFPPLLDPRTKEPSARTKGRWAWQRKGHIIL